MKKIPCSLSIKGNPTQILHFESFPDQISENYSTRWRSRGGHVSSEVTAFYGGGQFGSISLSLDFVAGLHKISVTHEVLDRVDVKLIEGRAVGVKIYKTVTNYQEELRLMERKVRWFQALGFPRPIKERTDNERAGLIMKGTPPRLLLTIGKFMTIECVMESINITWKAPFDPETVRPMAANIAITLKRLMTFYPDFDDINYNWSDMNVPAFELKKFLKSKSNANWIKGNLNWD